MAKPKPANTPNPCTVHPLSLSMLALVALRLALDSEGWAKAGERLLTSARATELLRRLPDPATTEPTGPAPIGRDASTAQLMTWHAEQQAWQAEHAAWAAREAAIELTDHQRDLCRQALQHDATAAAIQQRLGSRPLGELAQALGLGVAG